jgi:hypothetical protein
MGMMSRRTGASRTLQQNVNAPLTSLPKLDRYRSIARKAYRRLLTSR